MSSSCSSDSEPTSQLRKGKRKRQTDAPAVSSGEEHAVMSHAERRRQKKRAKLAANGLQEPVTARKGKPDASPTNRAAHHNSVWVGNLSFKTTQDALRTFFEPAGTVTRIYMPYKPGTKEIRGFAYVDFATASAKTAAIALSEKNLIGRRLLIKDGDDFTGRPLPGGTTPAESVPGMGLSKFARKTLRAQKQPQGPTLFLGNLSFETTATSIRELFEAHRRTKAKRQGQESQPEVQSWIRKVRMGTFEDTGKCKGWAFVDFASAEDATSALINPRNHRLDGRDLVVEFASPEAVRRGGYPPHSNKADAVPTPPVARKVERDAKQRTSAKSNVHDNLPAKDRDLASRHHSPDAPKSARTASKRAKPGAALMLAQRASAAIIPSQGNKIKF